MFPWQPFGVYIRKCNIWNILIYVSQCKRYLLLCNFRVDPFVGNWFPEYIYRSHPRIHVLNTESSTFPLTSLSECKVFKLIYCIGKSRWKSFFASRFFFQPHATFAQPCRQDDPYIIRCEPFLEDCIRLLNRSSVTITAHHKINEAVSFIECNTNLLLPPRKQKLLQYCLQIAHTPQHYCATFWLKLLNGRIHTRGIKELRHKMVFDLLLQKEREKVFE